MRTLVIGDIHGGLQALTQVLGRVEVRENDRFIFIGDYVDGWSESVETVSFLMGFSEKYTCIFLLGNHDELLLKYLTYNDSTPLWLSSGGSLTKMQYDTLPSENKGQHIAFLQNCKRFYIDEKNRLYCHAGFTNMRGPQYEYYANMTSWDRTLWEVACCMDHSLTPEDIHYPKRLKLFSEIYIGHTPVTRIGQRVPVRFANLWNVDTGAAFKGPLTILDIDTKKFWQSEPVWNLYPEERGRN